MSPQSNESVVSPPGQRDISPWLFLLLIASINIFGPFLPVPNLFVKLFGGILMTVLYVGVVIGFALAIAKKRFSIRAGLGGLAICALIWTIFDYGVNGYGVVDAVRDTLRGWREQGTVAAPIRQLIFFTVTSLQDAAMIAGAVFAGTLLARLIRHPNMIGPIGAAIALIDIWGVLFGGIVSQMLTNEATQPLAAKAMAAGPKMGAATATRHGYFLEIPAIGVGDFLFMGLLLSVLVNLAMNWRDSARWMYALVTLALLAITLLPWFPTLPGLLFIGAATVLPNLKYFRYEREEKFALLYAGIFVLILTVGLYYGFKAALPLNPNAPQGPIRPPTG